MFYEVSLTTGQSSALVALTPAESKRLIARAVATLPQVKRALKEGIVIIARGTTTAFVAEEILGVSIVPKADYAMGCITEGELRANASETRLRPFVIKGGEQVEVLPRDALREFRDGDVFIKGANAVDMWGNAGILVSGETGGTIGEAWPFVIPRGAHLIVPVGLEKLVPSVAEASRRCGIFRFKYSMGLPAGLVPLVNAEVVTEVQALRVLSGVSATHVASGGIGGSEGTVVLALEGKQEEVEQAFDLVKAIKGEPPVPKPAATEPLGASLNYDALSLWESRQARRR